MTDKIIELANVIKRNTKTENYSIKIESDNPEIYDSKIGGLPYWTDNEYPVGPDDQKLFLLAQINFEKEKVDSPLPTTGMLQFFILDDDLNGLDFDDPVKQVGFKVIYHEKVDYNITKESIEKRKEIVEANSDIECNPLEGEFKISLHKNVDYIYNSDYRFDEIFKKAYKEVYGKEMEGKFYFDVLSDSDSEKLFDEIEKGDEKGDEKEKAKGNHKMLGYPFFTQTDPRESEKLRIYDTLLFQLDSEGDKVCWGDVGVCNFFIQKDSLLKKDFSKVLYNWDCY